MSQELLSRAIRTRAAALTAQMAAPPGVGSATPPRALPVTAFTNRMPRHIRPRAGQVRAYVPLARYG